jgi:hypothetical protein
MRPARNRTMDATMELCRNIKSGPFGSLELICSNPRWDRPSFHYWPLNEHFELAPDQYSDFVHLVTGLLTDAVLTRLTVQGTIEGVIANTD